MRFIAFLRWVLVFVSMLVMFVVIYFTGLGSLITKNDPTFITWFILIAGAALSTRLGYITYMFSAGKRGIKWVETTIQEGNLGAGLASKLGFLGTGIGMVMALACFSSLDISNPTSLQGVLSDAMVGIMTALYTTIAGLVINIYLMLQSFNILHSLKLRKARHHND